MKTQKENINQVINTVNVLKLRTLKNIYFPAVRNFRNYVYEKMPVFEILECGLSQEKNGIYMHVKMW